MSGCGECGQPIVSEDVKDGMRSVMAWEIAHAIVEDIASRNGLRQSWESIDENIRVEIIAAWEAIILKELKR